MSFKTPIKDSTIFLNFTELSPLVLLTKVIGYSDILKLYFKANELRSNPSKHITYSHDDVIEFLSFGACVKILKDNRKNKEKEDWNVIDYDIIDYAYYVVNRRNDMDHYSDEKIEESVSKDSKILGYIFSNDIIDFFEKLEHI